MTRQVICAVAILIVTAARSHAADDVWQVGSAPGFSRGKYGSDTTTTVAQTPIAVRRSFNAGDLTAVLPFLCVQGSYISIVNGSPVASTSRPNASRGKNTPRESPSEG